MTEDRPGRRPHVAAMVQNVSLADDNRLQKQVDELLAAGYAVSVVTRHDEANAPWRRRPGLDLVEYPAPVDGDSTVSHLKEYAVSLVRQLPALARLHLRHRIDVLQICQPPDLYVPVAMVARRLGVRVLVDQRDLMPETLAQRYDAPPRRPIQVLHWLERRTQANVDATVTVNGYLRDRLVAAGGVPEGVTVVCNGPVLARVDRAATDPALPAPETLRRGFTHVVTWAGKMGRQDRVDQVLRVADLVVHGRGRADVGFMLLGDGECLEELRELVSSLGLDDHVWFPGWLSEVELYRHLGAADIGIDTSLQPEVTPVKAMEYLAVGLPLVAYDVQETRRLAQGAGVLVTPDDAEALADEVVALLEDPARRSRLGDVGRERVRRELAWERQSAGYLGVVAALVTTPRRRRSAPARRSRLAATPAGPAAP
jgi:glycosyltransferase involved in cell wall biosynthesis